MVSALSITLNMPNIGLILYYLICIIALPVILINTGKMDILQLYLPLLLPIASILQEAGNPNMYQNLLIKNKVNSVSIISTFLIVGLTVVGLLWYSISIALNNNSLGDGILVGSLVILLAWGYSRVLIPRFIKKGDEIIKEHTDFKPQYEMHKYLIGLVQLIIICLLLLGIQKMYYVDPNEVIKRKIKF